jgi:hypothetical protein
MLSEHKPHGFYYLSTMIIDALEMRTAIGYRWETAAVETPCNKRQGIFPVRKMSIFVSLANPAASRRRAQAAMATARYGDALAGWFKLGRIEAIHHIMGLQSHIKGGEVFKGVLLAHMILLLHLVIIAVVGVMVLVLGGLARNLLWFFFGAAVLVILSALLVYRRIKSHGRYTIAELDNMTLLKDRDVEVRVLGGLVTFSIIRSRKRRAIPTSAPKDRLRLTDPATHLIQEMSVLTDLLEKKILTPDEFRKAKRRLAESSE